VVSLDKLISAGIIGMGKMGVLHTGILNSINNIEVKALVDNQEALLNFVKNALPLINTYKDYREMLKKENLDVIYITTPTSLHAKMAIDCVNNGIPFFVEKPLGTSVDDCVPLINAAKENSIVNMVGYSKRFTDTFRMTKAILDCGDLGNLIYFNSSMYVSQLFSGGKGWRYKKESSGGGVLNTLATHLVDLILWYFGDVSFITGNAKSYYSKSVEDFVHAYLHFDNGIGGYLDASWSVRNYRLPEIKIEIHGDKGMLIVTDDYLKIYLDEIAGWKTYYKQDLFKGVEFDLGGPEYTLEDKHFIESVKNNEKTEIDIMQAFAVQKVIDAIYKSASKRCVVGRDDL